ncbi:efflux transporter outer membrane subunit [Allopusillimonas ginsengisoli]|uniref:efflux transporter outer membrane subunit n=1 Tax=Allopusillimonas ginsengisoli TaxID=453575 RepID=UPI001021276F|nr:efflux transporter outer membrane subunit [Allopusillimonas ginsengisoli]TEA71861.1 efflux transporter outer membrane subunit [Allopusillimonas ginsengisoli]
MFIKRLRVLAGLSGLALAMAGCAVGPSYQRPDVDMPAAFKEATLSPEAAQHWKAAQPADALERGQWWAIFQDAALDDLERRAMDANQNLKAAAARVEQARALQRDARSDRFPTVDVGIGPTRQRASNASQGLSQDAENSPVTLWRAQAGVSYEADLFGRVAAGVDAATANTEQSAALFQSVRLALQADVAQAYFRIRRLDAEQTLFERTVALRSKTLELVQQRYDAGEISELDLARARTELSSARSQSLAIKRERAAAEHALAILLGEPPSAFAMAEHPLDRVTAQIPAGLPSSLLERRPDIAAAERAMAAANARVGAAKAAFFPRLTLTGAFGYESSSLGDLFDWSSRAFLLGPLVGTALSLPIFDGGRRAAGLDNAQARYEEDVANYRQTVLQAFQEVEDGLSGLRILSEQTGVQDEAVRSAERAAQLSRIQYREGSVAYLDVIDADRAVLQQRQAAVRLDGERAHVAVDLIRAIGGGWDTAAMAMQ